MQWLNNIWNRLKQFLPGGSTSKLLEEQTYCSIKFELLVEQNEMLALIRAAELSMGGFGTPLDSYEKELLNKFLKDARESINSPGTFVTLED